MTGTPDGVQLSVRVVACAARTTLDGVVAGALRVRLAAPPVEGAANRALVAFLAELLDLPKRDVTIARGERGRQKLVLVRGLPPDELCRRLVGNQERHVPPGA